MRPLEAKTRLEAAIEAAARAKCRDVTPPELCCPTCIGRVRRDLTDIVTLAALMPTEAEHRGVNSEAAYLAGPAADPGSWTARKVYNKKLIEREAQ